MENTAAAASDSATASFGQAEDGQRKRPTKARRMMDFPRSSSASLLLQESNNSLSVRPSDSVFTSDEIAVLNEKSRRRDNGKWCSMDYSRGMS